MPKKSPSPGVQSDDSAVEGESLQLKTFRAAPLPNHKDPVRAKVIHLPGNWAKLSNGNWSDPGGNWSVPGGNSSVPGGNWSVPGGNWSDPGFSSGSCPGEAPRLVGMGYHSDLPDWRDKGWDEFSKFATKLKEEQGVGQRFDEKTRLAALAPPGQKTGPVTECNLGNDPKHPLPPIEDQGRTNSCTAQAAAGLMEYLYHKATGQYYDFSRIFIYFNSRRLLGWTGDVGSHVRTTFKAMRLFGAPPESDWPFNVSLLDAQPQPYQYAYANNFKSFRYARLDGYLDEPATTYDRVKEAILSGFPVEFGFAVYSSIQNIERFVIPVPTPADKILGGHAVLAVGFNDEVEYRNPNDTKSDPNGAINKGAIILRNSWGVSWGDQGYGFLPRWFLDQGCASDFWTAYDDDWLNVKPFD